MTFTDGEEASTGSIKQPTQDSKLQPTEVNPFYAELIGNERVTAVDHWQDVRLLTFDISDSNIVYVLCLLISRYHSVHFLSVNSETAANLSLAPSCILQLCKINS